MPDFDILPFPPGRQVIMDAGYLGAKRHIFYGLAEVDVTCARELLRAASEAGAPRSSFTAFMAVTLARAIEAHPEVQAYRDWRGRLVLFHDVDVVIMIEASPGAAAIPHVIRSANRKTVRQVTEEIRTIRDQPAKSSQNNWLVAVAPRLPRFIRLLFFKLIKLNPEWFKRLEGTVILTSVGMFGKGSFWGLTFLPVHTLGLTIGGIGQKPGVFEGAISIREVVNLTLAFDHDLVDGAPAARFAHTFIELIEKADALRDEST